MFWHVPCMKTSEINCDTYTDYKDSTLLKLRNCSVKCEEIRATKNAIDKNITKDLKC